MEYPWIVEESLEDLLLSSLGSGLEFLGLHGKRETERCISGDRRDEEERVSLKSIS